MEINETSEPKFIEMEGPVELAPDQNFYDQPPFNKILEEVAASTKLPPEDLRTALTIAARFAYDQPTPGLTQRKVSNGSIIPSSISGEEVVPGKRGLTLGQAFVNAKLSFNRCSHALQSMVDSLHEYSEWGAYINAELSDRDYYNRDGKRRPVTQVILTPSYGKWAENRRGIVSDEQLKERQKLIGLETIGPQNRMKTRSVFRILRKGQSG